MYGRRLVSLPGKGNKSKKGTPQASAEDAPKKGPKNSGVGMYRKDRKKKKAGRPAGGQAAGKKRRTS